MSCAAIREIGMAEDKYKFSIIIPVLNEQDLINPLIQDLRTQAFINTAEIIVVDGDPNRSTIDLIQDHKTTCATSKPGRARQMNTGATIARGEILIFLHADTRLPHDAIKKIADVLENKELVAGAFDLAIDSNRLILKYIAARARARSRINRIPYGDQAIFIRREYFEKIGRFTEMPLMEDIDLMRRIKKDGQRIYILKDRVTTSARRWENQGVIRTTLRIQLLVILYYLGVSPEKLAAYYRSHRTKSLQK
jgi:rSAM/selenodomain-associated transferase 2